MKTNYHIHTYRCKHAEGTDEDYIEAAINAGFTEIAFTDHSPWPLYPHESGMIRMHLNQLPEYVSSLRRLQEKYKDRIRIKIGLECEYFEDRMEWLKQTITDYSLETIILGNHFHHFDTFDRYYGSYRDKKNLISDYLEDSLAAIESGVYQMFAHPDIFVRSMDRWTPQAEETSRLILLACKQANLPIEYNLGGARNRFTEFSYPYPRFWELAAEIGNDVRIGIDAHSPMDFYDTASIRKAESFLATLGIKVNDEPL